MRLRGKRVMFVGDSLSLNQWQSLTCMLHVSVPRARYTLQRTVDLSIFTFPSYNASLMFFRDAFLVDITSEKIGRVLKLDSLRSSSVWKGMDTLIFNSWHWWLHTGRKQPWDFIEEGNEVRKDMNRLVAYEKALNTWARWVDSNVDPTKTNVFFQGVSPDHAK
ncbi:Protein trichome birefringence-like 43 [Sarracenia purpurea var. burkii]